MGVLSILAEAFRYPARDSLRSLQAGINTLPLGSASQALETFVQSVENLSLVDWEELYTRTFDLNPRVPPYVAYVIWGDGYARGSFMAKLGAAMQIAGVDFAGELPDHLVPLLRYLDKVSTPLTELDSILEPAFRSMYSCLVKADPNNIYLGLLAAVIEVLPLLDGAVSSDREG